MGLRLRHSVAYVATSDGMLFRFGDRILPVKGQNVFPWFARLAPRLSGQFTIAELCANVSESQRPVLQALCDALLEGGMLYEMDPGSAALVTPAIERSYAGVIGRIEARNNDPLRAFAAVRSTRLLIVGRSELVCEVAAAALEIGVCNQQVCAIDGTAQSDSRIEELVRQHRTGNADVSLWPDSREQFDVVVVAVDLERDREWLGRLSVNVDVCSRPVVPFLVSSGAVLAGPVPNDDPSGCLLCQILHWRDNEACTGNSAVNRAAGIAIGAQLLTLRVLASLSGTALPEDHRKYCEVALDSLEITVRPLTPHWACKRCGPIGAYPSATGSSFVGALWDDLEARLVDAKTGAVASVDEGALLQLPIHQSAALWRVPDASGEWVWTTECGADFESARIAVLRRALEHSLERLLPQDADDPGVVVSGLDERELFSNGLFRALSRTALTSPGWVDASLNTAPLTQTGGLILDYLTDIDVRPHIRVQRNVPLSAGGCDVLRFYYNDALVSVVSGWSGPEPWGAGLADIWLHATRREIFGPGKRDVSRPRLRWAAPEAASDSLHAAARKLGLMLTVEPLAGELIHLAAPLRFAFAQVVRCEQRVSCGGDSEGREARNEHVIYT